MLEVGNVHAGTLSRALPVIEKDQMPDPAVDRGLKEGHFRGLRGGQRELSGGANVNTYSRWIRVEPVT
jgi:hypothetical protein